MPAEEWRQFLDTKYEVSSAGRVRRQGRNPLKPVIHTNGYLKVKLGLAGEHYVHRMVCRTFFGEPPEPDCHADHINSQRADNRLENLRWLSPADNRALRSFRRGTAHGNSKLTDAAAREIKQSAATNVELAKRFGVARRTVADVRNGKTWSHINAA